MKTRHTMRRILTTVGLSLLYCAAAFAGSTVMPAIPYGENPAAAHRFTHDGVQLYFEEYGQGEPILLLHGNGESIASFKAQIPVLARRHHVIALDSRGHGHSQLGPTALSYELMANDVNALLEHIHTSRVLVLGHSDGGILALLLGIHHPDKVSRLAVMGANVDPSGAHDWARDGIVRQREKVQAELAGGKGGDAARFQLQLLDLMGNQPHIPLRELAAIRAPTLVMAGDRDVIRDEHTLSIFHAIPKSQLAIFPGATHMIPQEDPERFNRTVLAFFDRPFTSPDTKDLGWFD